MVLPLVALALYVPHASPATDSTASLSGTTAGSAGMYRLTEEQYRNTIADVFGMDIAVPGRFEAVMRRAHGLLASGSYLIAASPRATEQYSQMARAIAGQVVDATHRGVLISCKADAPDATVADACLARFFARVGRHLFRRPLTTGEVDQYVVLARSAGRQAGDPYTGLALGLEAMLISPRFLFQMDTAEADPLQSGQLRLTASSKATRLSFFLWNTSPDDELLTAAERGDLHDRVLLARQVDRMLASPRLEQGMRAFFSDMLELDELADLSKDAILYPQFIPDVRRDMSEQTLRTSIDLLLTQNRDYREVFTTRHTFITSTLAAIYGIPFDPGRKGWVPYDFPADSPRAGIVTQMTFLSEFSHPGRSSPTERGKALRELLLCQAVPDPPGTVDFTNFERSVNIKTARDRLTAHRANPVCAGCHKITDPIGLALEKFDAIGLYRETENGTPIDTSAMVEGAEVQDAVGLGRAIAASSAASSCVVKRLIEYGTRQAHPAGSWSEQMESRFAQMGYRLPLLLRTLATSDDFYRPHSDSPTQLQVRN